MPAVEGCCLRYNFDARQDKTRFEAKYWQIKYLVTLVISQYKNADVLILEPWHGLSNVPTTN